MFSEGEPFFPSAVWEKTCATNDQNFVFLRGFSGISFASLINRAFGCGFAALWTSQKVPDTTSALRDNGWYRRPIAGELGLNRGFFTPTSFQ